MRYIKGETNELQENQQKSGVLDVLSGNESIKFDFNLPAKTILIFCAAIILIGTYFIILKNKLR